MWGGGCTGSLGRRRNARNADGTVARTGNFLREEMMTRTDSSCGVHTVSQGPRESHHVKDPVKWASCFSHFTDGETEVYRG